MIDWSKKITVKDKKKKDEEEKQNKINRESLSYLDSTDWYIIRRQETGKEIPQEILEKREKAREDIKKSLNKKPAK